MGKRLEGANRYLRQENRYDPARHPRRPPPAWRARTPVCLPPRLAIYYARVTKRSPAAGASDPSQQEHEEVRIEVYHGVGGHFVLLFEQYVGL